MKKTLKTYEMKGFNEVHMSTKYCGVKVNLTFKGGNVAATPRKYARLMTDNKFAQDAIEQDERFKRGNIRLVDEVELTEGDAALESETSAQTAQKTAAKSRGKKNASASQQGETDKPAKDAEVVESVKTLNDVDAFFADRGVVLESSAKSYITELCEREGVVFPNLKY